MVAPIIGAVATHGTRIAAGGARASRSGGSQAAKRAQSKNAPTRIAARTLKSQAANDNEQQKPLERQRPRLQRRRLQNTTNISSALNLRKKYASFSIAWSVAWAEAFQFILGLFAIAAFGALFIPVLGSIFNIFGGEYLGVLIWLISVVIGFLAMWGAGLALKINGVRIVGERKWWILLLVGVIEFLPGLNLIPAITLWVLYLGFNPE